MQWNEAVSPHELLKDSLNKDDAIEVVQGFIKVSQIKDAAIKARSQINAATDSEI